MTPTDSLSRLREPFPPAAIGKLPRIWCKKCSEASGRVCSDHTKITCEDCRQKITGAHLHLDYVGHAEVTDRLLSVDPNWGWEPVAWGPDGLPVVESRERDLGLWIKLTVGGVTRLGYGTAPSGKGGDAVKEAIGDALRNAAMRFGVALDLWSKAELESQLEAEAPKTEPKKPPAKKEAPKAEADRGGSGAGQGSPPTEDSEDHRAELEALVEDEAAKRALNAWCRSHRVTNVIASMNDEQAFTAYCAVLEAIKEPANA